MGLGELIEQLFPRKKEPCESISCWLFPETVIERDFSHVFDLQEAIAAFGETIRESSIQAYGMPAETRKTTKDCIAYQWQTPEVQITYTVHIAQKGERRAVYNATLHLTQNAGNMDLYKTGTFLQKIVNEGVVASGPDYGAYMLSRASNGRTISVYKQTAEELGLSINRGCDFVPNKGWVYSARNAA